MLSEVGSQEDAVLVGLVGEIPVLLMPGRMSTDGCFPAGSLVEVEDNKAFKRGEH